MALIPFAKKLLIPPGSSDPRINARMGILHVDAGNAETLYGWFNGPSGGIESHGFITRSGVLEQYRDTDFEADANFHANPFATSWETQGFGRGEWTEEQLAMIKRVMIWSKEHDGIPLRVAESWNDPKGGWGYHTMWGSPSHWTPSVKTCPGIDRIPQFKDVLVPWLKAGGKIEKEDGTPNITAALEAKTFEERKAALKRVIRNGDDQAAMAAAAWLKALRAVQEAKDIATDAKQDLKLERVMI